MPTTSNQTESKLSITIKERLKNAGVDLSESIFNDETWHKLFPDYEEIREKLLFLAQSNNDPLKKIFIQAEIVSLAYHERIKTNELVLNSALEAIRLMTPQIQHQFNTSSTEESSLAGESDETNGNDA
jgi:hypothetical protein